MCPAVAAAPEETTGTPQTLTASEVKEMQQTDAAVTALTDSAAYAGMSEEERQTAALAQLDELAAQGLIEKEMAYSEPARFLLFLLRKMSMESCLVILPRYVERTSGLLSGMEFHAAR